MLNEKLKRRWAGCEALALGRGGISAVAEATGMSRNTIRKGMREVEEEHPRLSQSFDEHRVRKAGAGRKPLTQIDSTLLQDLKQLVEPDTRGEPTSALLWTSKSTCKLSDELKKLGHQVSTRTVAHLLQSLEYSLQGNRKTCEGKQHPDRDSQFRHINKKVRSFQRKKQPVVSVDAKHRELVGNFKNTGREWCPQGKPESVLTHDFRDKELGIAIPYGVYDLEQDAGWVSVGIDHNTAEFAVESIRHWWYRMGIQRYRDATDLLVTADAGSSNGYRSKLWKRCLQQLSNELKLRITVCHFPPGTSKWNKIEHRLFCHITQNWRGRPLTSLSIVVNCIANTRTQTGLTVNAELDPHNYPTGIVVSKEELAIINISRGKFHGEWNYTIAPNI